MKKATTEQLKSLADKYGISLAGLQTIVEVESKGKAFNNDGTPVILFEKHIFYKLLKNKGLTAIRDKAFKERPDLCYPKWQRGTYGLPSSQHSRCAVASTYHRETALESCSWGLGQIMGFHWSALGYPSLQAFVNAMYKDEISQIDAMCRFLKANKIITALNNQDWQKVALLYNGKEYKANQYDTKLANAYAKYKAKS